MSAVIPSCAGCGAATAPASTFCHACGIPSAQAVHVQRVVRGKILRDTNTGPGILSVLAAALALAWTGLRCLKSA